MGEKGVGKCNQSYRFLWRGCGIGISLSGSIPFLMFHFYTTFESMKPKLKKLLIKWTVFSIGVCVLLKAINKDVAVFDNCFGF
jgi:hypothetical protein